MPTAEEKIHQLLATYEQSLNTSDAALAADCYAPDGVFMPTTLPTASGAKLHAAYTQIFANIRLEVAFTVDELVVVSDRFAYALTRSNGTQTVLVSDTESREPTGRSSSSPERRVSGRSVATCSTSPNDRRPGSGTPKRSESPPLRLSYIAAEVRNFPRFSPGPAHYRERPFRPPRSGRCLLR